MTHMLLISLTTFPLWPLVLISILVVILLLLLIMIGFLHYLSRLVAVPKKYIHIREKYERAMKILRKDPAMLLIFIEDPDIRPLEFHMLILAAMESNIPFPDTEIRPCKNLIPTPVKYGLFKYEFLHTLERRLKGERELYQINIGLYQISGYCNRTLNSYIDKSFNDFKPFNVWEIWKWKRLITLEK